MQVVWLVSSSLAANRIKIMDPRYTTSHNEYLIKNYYDRQLTTYPPTIPYASFTNTSFIYQQMLL